MNTGRQGAMGFGLQTSGFVISGYSPPAPPGNVVSNVESFNGTSFTETTDVNTARGAGGATGTTTAGIFYAGSNPGGNTANTESWDGSTWTEVNDLATARADGSWTPSPSSGNTSALFADGAVPGSPGFSSGSEEWAFSGLNPSTTPAADYADAIIGDFYYNSTTGQFKTVNTGGAPIGSWASGGNLNTARAEHGGSGSQTAALAAAGYATAQVGVTEQYDGSSWTEVSDMNTNSENSSMTGTQTATISMGGYVPDEVCSALPVFKV